MRRLGGIALVAAGGIMLAAGCGETADKRSGGTSPPPSPSRSAAVAAPRPMATMPAGTKVELARKGRLQVCESPGGLPYLGASGPGVGGNGKVSGFEVDLLRLIAARLRATPLFVRTDPAELLDGGPLREKVCDVTPGLTAWGGFNKTFTLTRPYDHRSFAVLTKKGGPATVAGLAGKRVGVFGSGGGDAATDYATYLRKYNDAHGNAIHLIPQTDRLAQVAMLKAGRLDAVVTDDGRAAYNAKKDPTLTAGTPFGPGYTTVFAVRKGNKPLTRQINAALKDAATNGQYAKTYQDWFGHTPTWRPH